MPTMIRNDQNVIGTGGQFSRGTVSSPAIGASRRMLENQRTELRNFDRIFHLGGGLVGPAEQDQGPPILWLW